MLHRTLSAEVATFSRKVLGLLLLLGEIPKGYVNRVN